ncbi:MAG: hypothetical protein J7497_06370 [Chitinophagaceae bacterium]|nr:hypothetical protein [Chitinophagaceae bacterium]
MHQGLVHLHNLLRWVVLILLVISVIRHLGGMTGNKPFTNGDKKRNLFLMISAHIQFLVGLILWFIGPWGYKVLSTMGMGAAMKDPVYRFWTVEHNTGMLIAIVLITIGRGVSKKDLPDLTKHKKSFWFFLIALIVIFVSIPWPWRTVARPLFPGMH